MTKRGRKKPAIPYDEESHFITVDLDIFSRRRLTGLVEALGKAVFALYEGPLNSRYAARLELAIPSEMKLKTADGQIKQFISLIKMLPIEAQCLWDNAQSRTFDIGIQAGMEPHAYIMKISNQTIIEAARLGAAIATTTYAPHVDTNKGKIKKKRQRPPNHRLKLTAAQPKIPRPRSSA